MSLASNPSTPRYILDELAQRDDEWADDIQQSLARNPKYERR